MLDRYRKAVAYRSQWDNTYREVGRFVWPDAKNIVKSVKVENEGQVLTTDIADATAIRAALRMTSGIISYLMPSGVKWFDLKPKEESLRKNREILKRSSNATEVIHSAIWRSNFIREMFITIRSLVTFGTGCISVEKVDGELVFRNYHIADIFFEENSKGVIDVVFRRMFYTARQMVQEFGYDALPDAVRKCIDAKDYNQRFELVHCVYPRKDYDTEKKDASGMKFISKYISIDGEKVLSEGGFNSLPYKIGRYDRSPDELMGRSPAIDLLPDIKMLNEMRRTFIQSCDKVCNPPLIIEDDSVIGQPSTGPNDLIIKRAGSADPKPLETGANPQLTAEVIAQERQSIYEGFYNDVFQTLMHYGSSERKNRDEIYGLKEEKLSMLAPTIMGIQKEFIDKLILRCYDLLIVTKELPEGIGVDVDIVYQGILALAMSNMQTNAIELWVAKWSPYQQFYPVLDNVNIDEGSAESALNMGVPAKLIRTEDEVSEIRKAAQELQQAQQMAELAETGSKAIKNVEGLL